MIAVVTSCSCDGFIKYGSIGIGSLRTYLPSDVELHIVSEDVLPLGEDFGNVRIWNLLEHSPAAKEFYVRHAADAPAKGFILGGSRKGPYSWRHDAWKFSKKVFAIAAIARVLNGGRLIWIDADTRAFNPIPVSLLERMPPNEFALAHLARVGYHSECGFVGYNLDHPQTIPFIEAFEALYDTDDVFRWDEQHDSWVFDRLIEMRKVTAFAIQHVDNSHPFVASELGRYMDHLKGARKDLGRSPEHKRRWPTL